MMYWQRFLKEVEQVTPLAVVIGLIVLTVVILVASAGVKDE